MWRPAGVGGCAFGLGAVLAGIGPFLEQGAVEAFEFAIDVNEREVPTTDDPRRGHLDALDLADGETLRRGRMLLSERSVPSGFGIAVPLDRNGSEPADVPDLIAARGRSTVARTQLKGENTGDDEGHA